MFVLHNTAVADNDLTNASEFVAFWSQFYKDDIQVHGGKSKIDYIAELNLGQELNEENCRRLLRWKDLQFLTHEILSGPNVGQPNPRVQRTLAILQQINSFRSDELSENEFRRCTQKVFPNGLVWQVFIFHIAKPHAYPMADQNVFRAFRLHHAEVGSEDWDFYKQYREYFWQIAAQCGVDLLPDNIRALKQIDNALLVFGQFLKNYHRE